VINDWVKITWRIGPILALQNFNMCVGILSGPRALLGSSCCSRFSIPSTENVMWSQLGYTKLSRLGISSFSSVKKDIELIIKCIGYINRRSKQEVIILSKSSKSYI